MLAGSTKQEVLQQIDAAIALGRRAENTVDAWAQTPHRCITDENQSPSPIWSVSQEEEVRTFVIAGRAAIERIAGRDSEFYRSLPVAAEACNLSDHAAVGGVLGALRALRDAVQNGWLLRIERLVRAGVYDDFLMQTGELLNAQYHVAAMALAGGVLEEHLRQLCTTRDRTWKGAGSMSKYNDSLRDVAYNQPTWRRIQQIGDLRNVAAHGRVRT